MGGGGHDVFGAEPHRFVEASGGVVVDVKRRNVCLALPVVSIHSHLLDTVNPLP